MFSSKVHFVTHCHPSESVVFLFSFSFFLASRLQQLILIEAFVLSRLIRVIRLIRTVAPRVTPSSRDFATQFGRHRLPKRGSHKHEHEYESTSSANVEEYRAFKSRHQKSRSTWWVRRRVRVALHGRNCIQVTSSWLFVKLYCRANVDSLSPVRTRLTKLTRK